MLVQFFERGCLGRRVGKLAAGGIVSVALEIRYRLLFCPVRLRTSIVVRHQKSSAMEIIRGEVRAQICAMAKNRAVLHQAVTQENFLAMNHVGARKDYAPGRVHNLSGDWRFVRVGSVGKETQNQEAQEKDNRDGLNPASSDEKFPLRVLFHTLAPAEEWFPGASD